MKVLGWTVAVAVLAVVPTLALMYGAGMVLFFDGGFAVGPFTVSYVPGSWFPAHNV